MPRLPMFPRSPLTQGFRWWRLTGVTLLIVLLAVAGLVFLPAGQSAASEGCGGAGRMEVTVLVRPSGGERFAALGADGGSPYIDTSLGRTIVPLRPLFDALSPGQQVTTWDPQTRTASFRQQGHMISVAFPGGSTRAYSMRVDGRDLPIHSFLCNGRIYAPARYLVEAMGMEIRYFEHGIVVIDPVGR